MNARKRKILLYSGLAALAILIALIIFAEWYVRGLGPRARQRVIAALSDRFDADVKLQSLSLSLLPTPRVEGEGLEVRRHNHPSRNPFLKISRFAATATFGDLFYQRDHVGEVDLEGLVIDIPRRQEEVEPATQTPNKSSEKTLRVVIETLVANGAVLQIEPSSPDKDPLRWNIEKLTVHRVGAGLPLTFVTTLRNAKPPGLIHSVGSFGPWEREDLRATPVKGTYKFTNADLGVFSGIRGTLASTGSYNGHLDNIIVDGSTDVPDFALKRGGAPVHLTTDFHAVVDGTNGDTLLQPVHARFLHTSFTCKGAIEEKQPHTGKTVDLDAITTNARIEDIILLVTGDNTPVVDGDVRFHSKIVIPPGNQDVVDKLMLKGTFKLGSAIFTNPSVERRLGTLSDRARGISKKEEEGRPRRLVASDLSGAFSLRNGVADFSRLVFQVPGATIRLAGNYNLESERVDMKGIFRMQATLADTQSGFKHWLLVPLDPLFKKDGAGFQVPLEISGTRSNPELSVLALHHRFTLK